MVRIKTKTGKEEQIRTGRGNLRSQNQVSVTLSIISNSDRCPVPQKSIFSLERDQNLRQAMPQRYQIQSRPRDRRLHSFHPEEFSGLFSLTESSLSTKAGTFSLGQLRLADKSTPPEFKSTLERTHFACHSRPQVLTY